MEKQKQRKKYTKPKVKTHKVSSFFLACGTGGGCSPVNKAHGGNPCIP